MYAVIQTGGKQYRVQEGDVLRVAKLSAEAGNQVSFDKVLMLAEGESVKVGDDVAKLSVSAEVISHGRGPKIEIFKKRRRKHTQRTMGHRQDYTAVRITGIGAAKAVAEEKPVEAKQAAEPKAEAAEKPAAKKAVAPKAAAAKDEAKPAAKKAAAKSKDEE